MSLFTENSCDSGWYDVRSAAIPKVNDMLHSELHPRKTLHALPLMDFLQVELRYLQSPDPDDTWAQDDLNTRIEYYENYIRRLENWVPAQSK